MSSTTSSGDGTSYVDFGLDTNPDDVAQIAYDALTALAPGWSPIPSELDVWLIQAFARIAAETRDVTGMVADGIFAYWGQQIIGVQPLSGAPAAAPVTFTTVDTAGYTIPAGTVVILTAMDGTQYSFSTAADIVITPGSSTGSGSLVADDTGTPQNGIIAGAGQMGESLSYVTAVATTAATTGGSDAESDDDYLSRLRDEVALLAPRPIIASDFAVLARSASSEIVHALAIDGYNLTAGTPSNEKCCTVICFNAAGGAVSSGAKAAALALLQAMREVNFLVFVGDPTANTVSVDFTAKAQSGYNTATVNASIIAALQAYLNPATWSAPSDGTEAGWRVQPDVYVNELITVISNVVGVDRCVSVRVGSGGGVPSGTTDLVLSGLAPTATYGSVTGTTT